MLYISGTMPKSPNTVRKEVHLLPEVIKKLQDLADAERRSLKNLMEMVLEKYAEDNKKKSRS
jgi:mRNA-degrading endonuclease RelE of RelBE toxin-antitoxin system